MWDSWYARAMADGFGENWGLIGARGRGRVYVSIRWCAESESI